MYRVALVCEGPTDRAVIESILDGYLGDYVLDPIQPPLSAMGGGDAGPLGGGWKGVRLWCHQEASVGGGPLQVVLQNHDLVVIHVDADVAKESDGGVELGQDLTCPPPTVFSNPVRAAMLSWLGVSRPPAGSILCVPAMATEAWVLAALYPGSIVLCDPPPQTGVCVECDESIKAHLRKLGKKREPKLVIGDTNNPPGYRAAAREISEQWSEVISKCSEALRFDQELRAWLQARTRDPPQGIDDGDARTRAAGSGLGSPRRLSRRSWGRRWRWRHRHRRGP